MPRRSPPPLLSLPPRPPGVPSSRWLYDVLRAAILEGRMRPGTRLPSTRQLARHFSLARGTVVGAFEELACEGYLEAAVGVGSFVTRSLPDDLLQASVAARARRSLPHPPRRLSSFGRRAERFTDLDPAPARPFRCNLPAVDLFPTALWARITGRRIRSVTATQLAACNVRGYLPLREAIADYLGASRGVTCSAEHIFIVGGAQASLDLVARLLIEPGDRVAIENPGYPGATLIFAAHGARLVPIDVDEDGMPVDASALDAARLVYVTPAHQFPLGVTMSLTRRLELLDWAQATGAMIIEDDYDSEFRFEGRPLPALQGLDHHGQVLFVGSFSKVLFPALRLGYVVVPDDLCESLDAIVSITARHAPVLDQAALADFIAEGHFGRHLRRMRAHYAERLQALLDAGRKHLAGRLELSHIEAGLQTVGWLAPGLSSSAVVAAAGRRGVTVTPLSEYAVGLSANRQSHIDRALHLGFAAVDPDRLRRGVELLARALDEVEAGGK